MEDQNKRNIMNLLLKCLKKDDNGADISVNDINIRTEEGKIKFKIDIEGSVDADNLEELLKIFM